jgi:hypothetical protein
MSQGRLRAHLRERVRRMMPLERTGAFTLACVVVVALVAASCSAERAQPESERKEIGRQLAAAYDSCVRTSFASMLPTMVDRNMGIDQAFRVCRTEEEKLQAFEDSPSANPNVGAATVAAHRDRLKEELLRR